MDGSNLALSPFESAKVDAGAGCALGVPNPMEGRLEGSERVPSSLRRQSEFKMEELGLEATEDASEFLSIGSVRVLFNLRLSM